MTTNTDPRTKAQLVSVIEDLQIKLDELTQANADLTGPEAMATERENLTRAIRCAVAATYEEGDVWNYDTRRTESGNVLAWTHSRIASAIPQTYYSQLTWLERDQEEHRQMWRDAKAALEMDYMPTDAEKKPLTDVQKRTLQQQKDRAARRGKARTVEIIAFRALYEEAAKAYADVTGDEFTPWVAGQTPAVESDNEAEIFGS